MVRYASTRVNLVDKIQEIKTEHYTTLKELLSLSVRIDELEEIMHGEMGEHDLYNILKDDYKEVVNCLQDILTRDNVSAIRKTLKTFDKMKNKYDIIDKGKKGS